MRTAPETCTVDEAAAILHHTPAEIENMIGKVSLTRAGNAVTRESVTALYEFFTSEPEATADALLMDARLFKKPAKRNRRKQQ